MGDGCVRKRRVVALSFGFGVALASVPACNAALTDGGSPDAGGSACSNADDASTSGAGGSSGTSGAGGNAGSSGAGGRGGTGGTGGNAGSSGAGGRGGTGGGGSSGCGTPVVIGTSKKTIDVDGTQRSYLVVVPASLDPAIPAPLMLGFHGGSGTAEQASQYGLTGTEAALYVYPQALAFPGAGGIAWNVSPDGNDYAFIDALLVELGRRYCVDTTRIFAAGQSNGAFFVNQLGCYRPDTFRAIAPAAGGGPSSRCTKGVSAMIVHGIADNTVKIEQGMYSRDYWLAANGCSGAPSVPTDPAPCVAYSGCAKPVLWCQHNGAHSFPAFAGAAMRQFFLSF
jgi:polyhydroxybutyrate depolymerase